MRNEDFSVKGQSAPLLVARPEKQQAGLSVFRGLQGLKGQKVEVGPGDLFEAFQLQDLEDCEILLRGHMHALHIKRLTNCRVVSGPSKSAVHVEGCRGCRFVVMAHQVRIHHCEEVQFSLFVASRAIIEGSRALTFGPIREQAYEGVQADMEESGLAGRANLWREVQDFNWLKEEKSPNFALLE
jgi:hypothetical protein